MKTIIIAVLVLATLVVAVEAHGNKTCHQHNGVMHCR